MSDCFKNTNVCCVQNIFTFHISFAVETEFAEIVYLLGMPILLCVHYLFLHVLDAVLLYMQVHTTSCIPRLLIIPPKVYQGLYFQNTSFHVLTCFPFQPFGMEGSLTHWSTVNGPCMDVPSVVRIFPNTKSNKNYVATSFADLQRIEQMFFFVLRRIVVFMLLCTLTT